MKKGKVIGVTRLGEKLVIFRDKENNLYCIKDKCSHRGAQLSAGKLCKDYKAVKSPFHGF